jgi:hypothetical protein
MSTLLLGKANCLLVGFRSEHGDYGAFRVAPGLGQGKIPMNLCETS